MRAKIPPSLDRLRRFLGTLLKEPLSVGALVPSSRRLAESMVRDIGPGARVIELGAGTGVVTQAILDAGVAPGDLLVIEQNEGFSRLLRERFPGVAVITGNALSLGRHAAEPADFVVSGLPLLFFPAGHKNQLLSEVFRALRTGGSFHQFTYGGRCPVGRSMRRRLGLEASFLRFILCNIPPAFVYRLRKR